MTDRSTDHALESNDSALGDTLSADAMRWTPDAPNEPRETDSWERITITRADLIASEDLVEAPTDLAAEAGWTVPVALTRAAFADAVAWTQDNPLQDETGRWWDVLTMGSLAARAGGSAPRPFRVHRVPNWPGADWEAFPTDLVLNIGPGDAGEPVVTITTLEETP